MKNPYSLQFPFKLLMGFGYLIAFPSNSAADTLLRSDTRFIN